MSILRRYDLWIGLRHLLQARCQHSAWAAPVRIKFDNGHTARCEMLIDVHLLTMRNHFAWLSATSAAVVAWLTACCAE